MMIEEILNSSSHCDFYRECDFIECPPNVTSVQEFNACKYNYKHYFSKMEDKEELEGYKISGNSKLFDRIHSFIWGMDEDEMVRKGPIIIAKDKKAYMTKHGNFLVDWAKNSITVINPDKKTKRLVARAIRRER